MKTLIVYLKNMNEGIGYLRAHTKCCEIMFSRHFIFITSFHDKTIYVKIVVVEKNIVEHTV